MAQQEPQPETLQFRIFAKAPAPEDSRIYANHAAITVTPYDAALRFGLYTIPPLTAPPTEPVIDIPVEHAATVVIPIGLVRPLADLLNAQADSWERGQHTAESTNIPSTIETTE